MLSPRHMAATVAVLGALILGVLTVTGTLTLGEAAVTGAFLVMLGGLAFALLVLRRVDGKAQRIDLRVKKHEAGLAQTATALGRIETRLDRLAAAVEQSATQRNDDLAAVLASLGEDRVNTMAHAGEVAELGAEVRALRSAIDLVGGGRVVVGEVKEPA